MLILREKKDIEPILKNLTFDQCQTLLQALWKSLTEYSTANGGSEAASGPKLIHQPMREQFTTNHGNTSLFMPASDTNTTTGIKIVTLPGNGGAPKGAINIFSPEGDLHGLLNAEMITAFRTALASMVPFHKHRLPAKNANVVVFGAGKQAEWHIRLSLILAQGSIGRVTVVNRGRKNLDKLKSDLEAELTGDYPNVEFSYIARDLSDYDDKLRAVLSDSDAIFCCTPSTEPLFPHSYLVGSKQRFISLIGSYRPHMKEIDTETLLSGGGGKVLVDSKEACLKEAGELIEAKVSQDQLLEIGQSLGDDSSQGNTIFKCVGMGIMDLVIGRELLGLAKERGLGVAIEEF